MKKLVALLTLLCATAFASASPSDKEIADYATRMNLYVSMGQTPDQVAVSLSNYFGRANFVVSTAGTGFDMADVQYVVGSGTEITFMQTIGTMKVK